MGGSAGRTTLEVDGHPVSLSNLGKVLYPETGFTKAQVIDYYLRVAPVLLPHLANRPVTLVRFPNGVGGKSFYSKNAPTGRPEWVRTVTLPSPGSTKDRATVDYLLVDSLATLAWVANLAGLELHTPMWRLPTGRPDLVVADLDPGPPATVVECCRVASLLREAMADVVDGPLRVKTSGSKGLQVYGAVTDGRNGMRAREDMRRVAERLEGGHPDLVVANMRKNLRTGRVLLDWSQNNPAKTTVSVYSLRAKERPTVSTPLTWAEVEGCRRPGDLVFTAPDVLARVAEHGDLFAPAATAPPRVAEGE